jgi:hypothetical protein
VRSSRCGPGIASSRRPRGWNRWVDGPPRPHRASNHTCLMPQAVASAAADGRAQAAFEAGLCTLHMILRTKWPQKRGDPPRHRNATSMLIACSSRLNALRHFHSPRYRTATIRARAVSTVDAALAKLGTKNSGFPPGDGVFFGPATASSGSRLRSGTTPANPGPLARQGRRLPYGEPEPMP